MPKTETVKLLDHGGMGMTVGSVSNEIVTTPWTVSMVVSFPFFSSQHSMSVTSSAVRSMDGLKLRPPILATERNLVNPSTNTFMPGVWIEIVRGNPTGGSRSSPLHSPSALHLSWSVHTFPSSQGSSDGSGSEFWPVSVQDPAWHCHCLHSLPPPGWLWQGRPSSSSVTRVTVHVSGSTTL